MALTAISQVNVTGSGLLYTVPGQGLFRCELVSFSLVTDGTAGVHGAQLEYRAQNGATLSLQQDLNDVSASSTVHYTFGIGLVASTCTIVSGNAIEHPLPDCDLRPGDTIRVRAVDANGATIAGDSFQSISIYGEQVIPDTDTGGGSAVVVPLFAYGPATATV